MTKRVHIKIDASTQFGMDRSIFPLNRPISVAESKVKEN